MAEDRPVPRRILLVDADEFFVAVARLVDPEGALERRSHWEKTSHSLLVGAILHVLYACEDKTLADPRIGGHVPQCTALLLTELAEHVTE